MDRPAELEDLVQRYRWLRRYGLNDSHSGNASLRDGEQLWITPTGCGADSLSVQDMIPCPLDGADPEAASSDLALHRAVYRADADARVLLHSHGPASIAVTLQGERYVPTDFEGRYHFPDGIPVVDAGYEGYVTDGPALIAQALAAARICVYRGHGIWASGPDADLAYKWTCSLEQSARIAVLAHSMGVST